MMNFDGIDQKFIALKKCSLWLYYNYSLLAVLGMSLIIIVMSVDDGLLRTSMG